MDSQENASFWQHAAELRTVLVKAFIIIAIGMAFALFFYQSLFNLISYPLKQDEKAFLEQLEVKHLRIVNSGSTEQQYSLDSLSSTVVSSIISEGTKEIRQGTYRIPPGGFIELKHVKNPSTSLVMLGPLDGLMASLQMSFWIGLVGTSPVWVYFVLGFIAPALRPEENRLILPFLLLSFLFLAIGLLFAFFLTIPLANLYLQGFNSSIGTNLWTLSSYLDYTIALMLANAFAFELSLILFFLVYLGVLSAQAMQEKRRHAVVIAFIMGAVLTPPDILTQFMLALPLIGLYEITILYAKIREKKKEKKRKEIYFTRT